MKQLLLVLPIAISIVSSALSARAVPPEAQINKTVDVSKSPTAKFDDRLLNPQPLPPKDSPFKLRPSLPSANSNLDIRQLNPQPLPPKNAR